MLGLGPRVCVRGLRPGERFLVRLLIHDTSGHPFQIQLSRWLARRGHQVLHCTWADMETPHGSLDRRADDPPTLEVARLSLGQPVPKYNFIKRWFVERRFARLLASRVRAFHPDVAVTANATPIVQAAVLRAAHSQGAAVVDWLQDIVSVIAAIILPERHPRLGPLVAALLRFQEFRVLRRCERVACISPDFVPLCRAGGVAADKIAVLPNWAPLPELPLLPRDNEWARRHGLVGKRVALYSGTLGLKHNPLMLSTLARSLREVDDARVVVISQGLGRAALEEAKQRWSLDNLLLLDFQPFEDMPAILASADLLLALLEEHAGPMAVPSKVLTYLCAGRPILGAIPGDNLAARVILEAGAGRVVAPGDSFLFDEAARAILEDREGAQSMGAAARAYAERTFEIEMIGPKFESLFNDALLSRRQG